MTTAGLSRLKFFIEQSRTRFALQSKSTILRPTPQIVLFVKPLFNFSGNKMCSRPKAYVTRADYPSEGIDLLRSECDVTMWSDKSPVPRKELFRSIAGQNALFCALNDKIDKELLDAAGPQLKVIATMSVGYDHIDLEECKKRGIRIGYTPTVLTDATAELTIALLLATSRLLFEANKQVYNGGWKSWAPTWMCGHSLKGKNIGIFGYGRIGHEIAKRLVPFKPNCIIYTSRLPKPHAEAMGLIKAEFEDLLKESDIIIVSCALTPETKCIFNEEAFAKMKTSAIFINTARGGIVDQTALVEALKNRCIGAAGLDVMTPEPVPKDDPLLKLDNVVLLPHIGSADIETRREMSIQTATNIINALKGVDLVNEV